MDHVKSVPERSRAIASSGLARRNSSIALAFPFKTNAAASELISFLKALPDCRMRRRITADTLVMPP
jgi:hypothetical protein